MHVIYFYAPHVLIDVHTMLEHMPQGLFTVAICVLRSRLFLLMLASLTVNSTIKVNGTYLLAMSQMLTQMPTVNRPTCHTSDDTKDMTLTMLLLL